MADIILASTKVHNQAMRPSLLAKYEAKVLKRFQYLNGTFLNSSENDFFGVYHDLDTNSVIGAIHLYDPETSRTNPSINIEDISSMQDEVFCLPVDKFYNWGSNKISETDPDKITRMSIRHYYDINLYLRFKVIDDELYFNVSRYDAKQYKKYFGKKETLHYSLILNKLDIMLIKHKIKEHTCK